MENSFTSVVLANFGKQPCERSSKEKRQMKNSRREECGVRAQRPPYSRRFIPPINPHLRFPNSVCVKKVQKLKLELEKLIEWQQHKEILFTGGLRIPRARWVRVH